MDRDWLRRSTCTPGREGGCETSGLASILSSRVIAAWWGNGSGAVAGSWPSATLVEFSGGSGWKCTGTCSVQCREQERKWCACPERERNRLDYC
ncbi:hypothetical protein CEXT_631001 [Caerostris extrusa]|uniref:Uncharacterized protein n=1 Tax=Caerostris extrusa TaxID=172846 RepID=A0AAV4MXS2_CAEEX|nr:hypothetical protein CEXT_631001 [Caerostris extrusa]